MDDTRDRLIRLETRMEHVEEKLDATAKQVSEMHDLLMQAKGMKYVVVGMAMVGGFIAAKLGTILAFFRA